MGEGGEDRVAIRARWRRLRNSIEGVRDVVSAVGADENVRDAVAFALDALYDMAEAVKHKGGFTNRTVEDVVAGDVGGETTQGLLWARGEKTHALVDFGDLHTFGSDGYGEGPTAEDGPGKARTKTRGSQYDPPGTPVAYAVIVSWTRLM